MYRVAVAKAVSIVIAYHRLPTIGMIDLKLHGLIDDPLATTPIRATQPHVVWDNVHKPRVFSNIGVCHRARSPF
jgi:hypothetical protein